MLESSFPRQPSFQRWSRRHGVRCALADDVRQSVGFDYSKNGKSRAPSAPFKVVITGSTKGVGFELAREFLRAGDDVILSSRHYDHVRQAVRALHEEFGDDRAISGVTCDVTKEKEVADLADYARSEFGAVHFWINNAGTNNYKYGPLAEFTQDDIQQILNTNILGSMLGCKHAIKVMQYQNIDGHIFNIDGAGADGNPTGNYAAYGATKYAIVQLNRSLSQELKQQNIDNIGIHILSPGMCITDLLMCTELSKETRFFINCLAEHPEVPAKYLVPRVRQMPSENKGDDIQNRKIAYLTKTKAYTQIFKRLVFQERKGLHVPED